MLWNFLPYVFFNCKLHKQWQLLFKSPFIISALSFILFYSPHPRQIIIIIMGRGDSGAEVTGVEVSGAEVIGAEVIGAEVTRGRGGSGAEVSVNRIFRLSSYWLQSPRLHYNLYRLRLGHCIYCWKAAIAVHVNATILGYRIKKAATSSQNMGHFGPVLVRPGQFGLSLGVGWLSLKGVSFRPWVVSAVGRLGPVSIRRVREWLNMV